MIYNFPCENIFRTYKEELGILMQKITTDKIKISNTGSGMKEALNLTEHIAGVMGLDNRSQFHARLLAEELFSMVRAITGEFSAEYWLEADMAGQACTFHLDAKAELDYSKKRELISASTKGKNAARLGIMERIRDIIQAGLYTFEESAEIQSQYGTGFFNYGAMGMTTDDAGMSEAIYSWSMQKYKQDVQEDSDKDSWDELEKSIIANIADEVQVGINRDSITLTIYKTFKK